MALTYLATAFQNLGGTIRAVRADDWQPQASASTMTLPKPSHRDERTKTDARAMYGKGFGTKPSRSTASRRRAPQASPISGAPACGLPSILAGPEDHQPRLEHPPQSCERPDQCRIDLWLGGAGPRPAPPEVRRNEPRMINFAAAFSFRLPETTGL